MSVEVEAKLTVEIAKTMIFPASVRYQNQLASTCANLKLVGYEFDTNTLDKVTALVKDLQDSIGVLEAKMAEDAGEDSLAHASHYCDAMMPAMASAPQYADALEGWVADDLWPLPTYQEMLFIRKSRRENGKAGLPPLGRGHAPASSSKRADARV